MEPFPFIKAKIFFANPYVNFNIITFSNSWEERFSYTLKRSIEIHGHFCPGQVVAVPMAMLGCRCFELDVQERQDQIKKLIIYEVIE